MNKQKGASVLMLLGIILVVVVLSLLILRVMISPDPEIRDNDVDDPYKEPRYELDLGNVRFIFQEAVDKGRILVRPPGERGGNLESTERFIKVTIGARNIGRMTIGGRNWKINNLIDGEGRVFEPKGREVNDWLPEDNMCGENLYPGFSPLYCSKIYEVANVSRNLQVEVESEAGIDYVDLFVIPESDL